MSQEKDLPFTVMTQNVYTDIDEIPTSRIKLLIKTIERHNPDVFFLQEAALKQHRDVLNSKITKDYFLLSSQCRHVKYRLKSYIPFIVLISISMLLMINGVSITIVIIFQALGILLLPPIFIRFLAYCCCIKAAEQMINHELDHQGLMIGIKKVSDVLIDAIPVYLEAQPFENLGYKFALNEIYLWPMTWIQFTYLRPGYLFVKYGETLLINAHLATGQINSNRMEQVQELHEKINEITKSEYTDIKQIIIGCDCNAHDNQPEIRYIEQEMKFIDCWRKSNDNNCNDNNGYKENNGYTWCNQNELVANGKFKEDDQRIDYIFYRDIEKQRYSASSSQLISTTKPYLSDHFGVLVEFQIV